MLAFFKIVPSNGRYYFGLTRTTHELFTEIPWLTEHVPALTQEKTTTLGLKMALLPQWRDIDTIEALRAHIESSALDAKKPRNDHLFSSRTAGALQPIASRLQSRSSPTAHAGGKCGP